MFDHWVGKIPWSRKWQLSPVFLLEESHGQRSLTGYSPWDRQESDMTEWLKVIQPITRTSYSCPYFSGPFLRVTFCLSGSDRLWEIPLCFSYLSLRSFYPCFIHLRNSVDVSVEKWHVFEASQCSISVSPSSYVCPKLCPTNFPALVSESAFFLGQIQVISLWPILRICQCPQGQLQNLAHLCHV